jgi:hypothetical protein
LLVVLATHAQWMTREQLALIFWPDAAPADALHRVRVNVHRARSLLEAWGMADALQAERSRVLLTLPSDLAQLRAAQASTDVNVLQRLSPAQWLQGWRLPGFDGFAQWSEQMAQQLQREWLAASKRAFAEIMAVDPSVEHLAAPPGRQVQLRRLLASPAPALLVVGEPGAGKTTLLRSAFPQAPCLRGFEGLHGMPYRPLLDCLRERQDTLSRALSEPSHSLRPYRLDLARVLPELAPDEPLPPLDALTARTRLAEALARAFEALTPVLLVDDLQWCDGSTVEWLLMLAHSGRLRWRATARRHEIGASLAQHLQSLRSAVRLETLDLPPLSRAAIAQACNQRWPQETFSQIQIDRLHTLSGGNAFLLGELVTASVRGDDDVSQTVQARVRQLVNNRLQSLSRAAQVAVEAAAVFVQPVQAAALLKSAETTTLNVEPFDDVAVAAACDEAISAGLLSASQSDMLRCRHDLIRQAIASGLAPARRLSLNWSCPFLTDTLLC